MDAAPPEPVLDFRHVEQLKSMRLPGKPSLFIELAAMFRKEAPGRITKLAEALASRDTEQLSRLAHAMVGSLATLGARRMQQAARSLEQAADHGDWNEVLSAHSHLLGSWTELENAFDQHINEEHS